MYVRKMHNPHVALHGKGTYLLIKHCLIVLYALFLDRNVDHSPGKFVVVFSIALLHSDILLF